MALTFDVYVTHHIVGSQNPQVLVKKNTESRGKFSSVGVENPPGFRLSQWLLGKQNG